MDQQSAALANQETEAKYHLSSPLSPTALADLRLAPYTLRLQKEERQRDSLLDTADHTLYHLGYALRVRRIQRQLVVTLKRPGAVSGSVHIREELEAPVAAADSLAPRRWPPAVGAPVLALIGDAPILPLVELHTQRATWRVERAGQLVAELVVDNGTLIAHGATANIQEVEVELKGEGATDDLHRLDRRLRKRLGLTPERQSKFARGMALLEATERVRGGFLPIATVGRVLLTDEVKKLRKHGAWLERRSHPRRLHGDPEKASNHIHKLRVVTRRLRIALDMVGALPQSQSTTLRQLDRRLQRLGRLLGALRDGEIVQQRLDSHLQRFGVLRGSSRRSARGVAQRRQANRVRKAVRMQHRSAQSSLHEALQRGVIERLAADLDRLARVLRGVERASEPPAGARRGTVVRAREVVGGMLWRQYEEVEQLGAMAMRTDAVADDRHRLRRACKRLRYTLEATQAAQIAPDMDELLPRTALAAQNHLGDLQDDTLVLRAIHDASANTTATDRKQGAHGADRARARAGQHPHAERQGVVDAIADETRASMARGIAAFWPIWERLSGAPYRTTLAENIARL